MVLLLTGGYNRRALFCDPIISQIALPLIVEVNSRLKLANCLLLPLNSTLT